MPPRPLAASDDAPAPLSTPVFQILLSLVDAELHGYALIQDIRDRTGGEVDLTASTLYAAMKRLLDVAWIDEIDAPPAREKSDPRRRYYRITARGRAAAREEARRVERLTAQAREKRLLPSTRTAPSARGAR